jgi:uncharacterized protein YbcC (UPF0753/DUF2309 family)
MTDIIKESWKIIAPFWPLENLIAVNPLQGLEDLKFEEALNKASTYFESEKLPQAMESVNLETIKWLQVFCDESQATISMPGREIGLYNAWRKLAGFDKKLKAINILPHSAEETIMNCLELLEIEKADQQEFLTLLLTTLPGWASHIKYRTDWSDIQQYPRSLISQEEYLAVRISITYLLWPEAKELLQWHRSIEKKNRLLAEIKVNEKKYRLPLLKQLSSQKLSETKNPDAQLVFCIDVRSEPFRWAIEKTGNYETFGFAGFFGIPVEIENAITGNRYSSCPVLLKPKHLVTETPNCGHKEHNKYRLSNNSKLFYQSLKYNFTTAFALVETLGLLTGIWMFVRSFMPNLANKVSKSIRSADELKPSLDNISFSDQSLYAESALRMIGLTQNFAPLVLLCGHGSSTENNAFATALDCGACGGRHGASNARILAAILNDVKIRRLLAEKQILIPKETIFIAAEHNTTNDEVKLYNSENIDGTPQILKDSHYMAQLNQDLKKAADINSNFRCNQMDVKGGSRQTKLRSIDWSQPRPEWGLAGNAAFIIGPRSLTKNIDLEGRCFLHSYDYAQDVECNSLNVILTAPMVVAQWINAQYLFSTMNNVAYGAGSKITKNITGKIGVMQGNASDLMTGLPLQSVYISDSEAYHEMQRLMTVVYAPRAMLDKIIAKQEILKKLFGNGWVRLTCIDPSDNQIYFLNEDIKWQSTNI